MRRRPGWMGWATAALMVVVLAGARAAAAGPTDDLRAEVERMIKVLEDPELKKEGRAADRRAAIRTSTEIAGRKRFRGEVVAADEREVTLATSGERVDIPYDAIARGNLIDEG